MKESKTFEANLKKLETITRKLESNDVSLDESLALFEEGIKLVKTLQAKLSEVERRVEILIKETDDTHRLEPFDESKPDEGT